MTGQTGGEGFNNVHDEDSEELLEGHVAELKDEELVELTSMPSAEEEEGENFAHPQLVLDNLAESFMIVKAVTDYFYNIDPSMIRGLNSKSRLRTSLSLISRSSRT